MLRDAGRYGPPCSGRTNYYQSAHSQREIERMNKNAAAIEQIRAAFRPNPFPGNPFLQGSFDGSEGYEETSPFHGRDNWAAIEPEFLDAHPSALTFFSEAGFRFFLPAYLVADLEGRLMEADPVFHLTHGFVAHSYEQNLAGRTFLRQFGPQAFVNPLRYGAMTFSDAARHQLSVFTREEAQAIIAYLRCRRESAETAREREEVDQALDAYWLERARTAPTAESLARQQADDAVYSAAIRESIAPLMQSAAAPPREDGSSGE
jgi:hypothetical protein